MSQTEPYIICNGSEMKRIIIKQMTQHIRRSSDEMTQQMRHLEQENETKQHRLADSTISGSNERKPSISNSQ